MNKLSLGRTFVSLAISYTLGFAAIGVLLLPFGAIGLIVTVGEWLIALPFLGVTAIVVLLFKRSIAQHRAWWCAVSPAVLIGCWLTWEYKFSYYGLRYDFIDYLQIRNVGERAAFVALVSIISAISFYFIERSGSDSEKK